jgi:hypothetical protein
VSDGAQQWAYIRIATGELVAVDLMEGAVRWRRQQSGRPIAASRRYVLTLDEQASPLRFELLDSATGAQIASIDGRDVPGFDPETSAADPIEVEIEESPAGPHVRWRSERRYHGGASLPAGSTALPPQAGEFRIQEESGKVRPIDTAGLALGGAATGPEFPPDETEVTEPPPASQFRLTQQGAPGSGKIVLEKLDPASGVSWSTELGPLPELRPKPLRK